MFSLKRKLDLKYLAIISHTGFLMVVLGLLLLIPLLSLFFSPEKPELLRAFLLPSAGSILAGIILWRGFRPKETVFLTTPDAAIIVTSIWVIAILLGAMPFVLSNTLSVVDVTSQRFSSCGEASCSLSEVQD
jgi:trk system potassium uptake protein TrkH